MGLFSRGKAKKKTDEGFQHHQARDLATAEFMFREAIQIHPPYADAHFRLAELLLEQNRIPEAEIRALLEDVEADTDGSGYAASESAAD